MQQKLTQARPYARAAFEYADAQNKLNAWKNVLSDLALLTAEPSVANYLVNPKVSPPQAVALFADIFVEQLDMQLKNLLRLLAEARQLNLLPSIAQLFTQYEAAHLKIETIEVLAAKQLTVAQQEKLNVALSKRLQKQVKLNCKVAPELLGGAIVRTEKWMLDGSVKGKLEQLKTILAG